MQQEKLRIPTILQNGQRTQKTKKFFGRIFSKRRDLKIPNPGEAEREAGARPGLPKAVGRRPETRKNFCAPGDWSFFPGGIYGILNLSMTVKGRSL